MWILQINDMRTPKIEMVRPVAYAETEQQIIDYLKSQEVEPYREGVWGKCYQKDGPLEWYNPPSLTTTFVPAIVDIGTEDDWRSEASMRYHELLDSITYKI